MANNQLITDPSVWNTIAHLRQNDPGCLAPAFRAALLRGIARANDRGFPLESEETCRSQQLQSIYFDQGTTKAQDARRAWHIYGLADDAVHPTKGWNAYPGGKAHDPAWVAGVADAMKAEGLLAWGGDWVHFKDYPHWQWIHCKPTPSDEAVRLYQLGGRNAVWMKVGAMAG